MGSPELSDRTFRQSAIGLKEHVARFLQTMPAYHCWSHQFVGISPILDADHRATLTNHDIIPQDLNDLTLGLE